MISRFLKLMPLMLLLGACGGSGGKPPPTGNDGGTGGGTATASSLSISTSAPTMPGDGSAPATITAFARDANNSLIANVPVTFSASSGGVAGSPAVTGANGEATATLSPAGDATPRTITVTATSGSLTATVNVQVVAGGTTSVQMGSGTGAQFQSGIIAVSSATLSAGGSTSLQVVLQQSDGTLYTQPATVSFSSPCAAQGLATITSPVETSTGIASSTYAATGCSGQDAITATATVGGAPLSAAGTVTVAQASIGSIVFESATPTNIALRGTGEAGRPETSTVVFRVLDQTSGPRAGATVTFALNTTVGGLSLSPVSAQSDSTGRVQTVVQGGTVATTVRVTATVTSVTPAISTQSNQLTVTTGIPDQDSFSMAVECPNVEAWNLDGTSVPVTVRLSDRFNNPVPDGTAITFTTEGGRIQSQCTTGTLSDESGVCSVNWTSSNPRPADGRSSLLATAIGEESFSDANGNGSFDNGETFEDLGERFRNDNESPTYDVGEVIYDFNNNSTRDPADGIFNGVLCLDTAGRCDPARVTTGIGASNVIVMSDNTPAGVVPQNGSTVGPIAQGATNSFSFLFADVNGNPLPAETTIAASITGTGLTVGTPNSFRVPCTRTATSYSFSISASPTAVDGTLTILVTTPSGLQTQLTYPVDVL